MAKRAVHGWLIVDKPLGVTSTQVVGRARWAVEAKKAGHAGTLDPLATGLVAVAFGEATKTVPFAMEGLKTYRFTIRLGLRTSTDDAEGGVIAESGLRPADAEIEAALGAFTGDIMQVPPVFSAVKVAGERAYDLARAGEFRELAARPLHVARLALLARPDPDHAEMELICGKGGYVRAIARDLGEVLGCHGHVVALRRLVAGPFTLEGAVPYEALEGFRETEAPLLPVAAGLRDLREVPVGALAAARLRQGQAAEVAVPGFGDAAWASEGGEPVAIGTLRGGQFRPERVFVFGE